MALSVATFQIFCRDQRQSRFSSNWVVPAISDTSRMMRRAGGGRKLIKRDAKVEAAFWQDTKPTAIELEAIADMDQFDRILLEAQEQSQPIVVDWMAAWCRKCIFLKPKLEKLAAEYHTRLNFYYVDVNNVSQALVKRGNISKMPTIQLWKGGEMKEQVIGGHKAWLVIDQVREMIQNHI